MKISLGIGILFYNRTDQTIECLASFIDSGVNIYVLNNASEKEARKKLGAFCKQHKQIIIFDSSKNLGVAMGRNFLIKHTNEKWLLFVDNDITIRTTNWLNIITKTIKQNPDIEVFIPKLFNVHEHSYARNQQLRVHKGVARFSWVSKRVGKSNMFPGGASICSRKLFERLGPYDKKMFVGFEDFEMGIRGLRSGAPIRAMIIDKIELFHDHRIVEAQHDIDAVKTRYDIEKITLSEERIYQKHEVKLDNDWRPWVKKQVKKITGKRSRFIMALKRYISLIWKNLKSH